MGLPRATQWEGESQEYFLEEVAVALGQQAGAFDWAKGQKAGVLGMVKRMVGSVRGQGRAQCPAQRRAEVGEAHGAFVELN